MFQLTLDGKSGTGKAAGLAGVSVSCNINNS
jgi:hypothetical protein